MLWLTSLAMECRQMADEKDLARERLRSAIARVPASVNSGTVQLAREYKDFYTKASSLVKSQKATLQQLNSAIATAQAFNNPTRAVHA